MKLLINNKNSWQRRSFNVYLDISKSSLNNIPDSLLLRAEIATNSDGTPIYSLQQSVSIENIDGYIQPLDQLYLYDFGITTNIHAHKLHTGFSTRFTNGVTSIGIYSLCVTMLF